MLMKPAESHAHCAETTAFRCLEQILSRQNFDNKSATCEFNPSSVMAMRLEQGSKGEPYVSMVHCRIRGAVYVNAACILFTEPTGKGRHI